MSRRLGRWSFGVLLVLLIAGVVVAFAWRRLGVLPYKAPGVRLAYAVPSHLSETTAVVLRQRLAGHPNADVRVDAAGKLVVTVWPAQTEADLQSEKYRLLEVLRPIGTLEFFRVMSPETEDGAAMRTRDVLDRRLGDTSHWAPVYDRDPDAYKTGAIVRTEYGQLYVLLNDLPEFCMTRKPGSMPWAVVQATPVRNDDGSLAVSFRLDAEGARQFGKLTTACLNQRMAMVVDDAIYSAPYVRSMIPGGECVITTGRDGFTPPEQMRLVQLLNAGTLPVALGTPVEENEGPFTVPAQRVPMLIAAGALVMLFIGLAVSGYYGFVRTPKPVIEVLTG